MAISDAVGNSSSPRWYVWNTVAVRPLAVSQSLSALSRGMVVNPPAAAPHSTWQEGTSLMPRTQRLSRSVSSGPRRPFSLERNLVTASVTAEVSANAYTPGPVTVVPRSNVTARASAAGGTFATWSPTAGAVPAVSVFCVHDVPDSRSRVSGTAPVAPSVVSVSCAPDTVVFGGSGSTVNFR